MIECLVEPLHIFLMMPNPSMLVATIPYIRARTLVLLVFVYVIPFAILLVVNAFVIRAIHQSVLISNK
jgi:hypothetical protein